MVVTKLCTLLLLFHLCWNLTEAKDVKLPTQTKNSDHSSLLTAVETLQKLYQQQQKAIQLQQEQITKLQHENDNHRNKITNLQQTNANMELAIKEQKNQQQTNANMELGLKEQKNQQQTNANMEIGLKSQHDQILKLHQENEKLKLSQQNHQNQITDLQQKNQQQSVQQTHVNMELVLEDISNLKHGLVSLHHRCSVNQTKTDAKLHEIADMLEKQNGFVSFTAWATEPQSYNAKEQVLFDAAVRNYGGNYNIETSTFVCPFEAYYLFSVSILAMNGEKMATQIMLDEELLVTARGEDASHYDSSSTLVVTHCDAGQEVWVRDHNSGGVMHGSTARFSTFSGTLLRIA